MKVYFVKLGDDYWSDTEDLHCWHFSSFREGAFPFATRKDAETLLKRRVEDQSWQGSSRGRGYDYKKFTRVDFKIVSLRNVAALRFWIERLSSKIDDLEAKMENHRL